MKWALLFLAGCAVDIGGGAESSCEAHNRAVEEYEGACGVTHGGSLPDCDGLLFYEIDLAACRKALSELPCSATKLPSECNSKRFAL